MTSPAETAQLVEVVRRFAREEIAPLVRDYDRAEEIPRHVLSRMAEMQLFGGTVPTEWGGLGLDHATYARVIEEISVVDHNLGVLMSMPSALVGSGILRYGSDRQKDRWLRPLAAGEIFGAAGVTEPHSGTDFAGLQTTYRKLGDRYRISGSKIWISNLNYASFVVVFAKAAASNGGPPLISAFVVERDTPGLELRPFKNKLGFRPLATGEVVLGDVEVGSDALLGEEGQGMRVAMTAVERGRLAVAARAVGLIRASMEASITYAKTREVFGKPIAEYQLTKAKITQMVVDLEASRALVEKAAAALDAGQRGRRETSMAKLVATDAALSAATEAVQIHGAYGVSDEFPVARLFRDAKVFQIVEGTNELHRLLIAEYELGLRKD